MSLSGSSASRNSIWAMTRLASSSSMKVGRKMIRSLSRREKMSNARSPRGVCSMTMGTSAITFSLSFRPRRTTRRLGRGGRRLRDQPVEGLPFTKPEAETVEVTALLHHTLDGGQGPLTGLRDALDFRVHLGLAGGQPLALGDRLQQKRAADGPLGARLQLGNQLAVIPGNPLGIDPLPAQPLARVLDLVRSLPHHQRVGDGELVPGQERIHDLLVESPAFLASASPLELAADFRPESVQ